MNRSYLLLTMGALLAGCAGAVPSTPAERPDVVVASVESTGNRSAMLSLAAKADDGYRTQAVQHRWVVADIHQYEATVKVRQADNSFADVSPAVTVILPQKGTPKSTAVFNNLSQGKFYRVEIAAKGNDGGTQALTVLNSLTPCTADFDFTAAQNVTDVVTANVTVALDPVDFTGTGGVTIQTPAEGIFRNPSDPAVGTAE